MQQVKLFIDSCAFHMNATMGRELYGLSVSAEPCDTICSQDALGAPLGGVGRVDGLLGSGGAVIDNLTGGGGSKQLLLGCGELAELLLG